MTQQKIRNVPHLSSIPAVDGVAFQMFRFCRRSNVNDKRKFSNGDLVRLGEWLEWHSNQDNNIEFGYLD